MRIAAASLSWPRIETERLPFTRARAAARSRSHRRRIVAAPAQEAEVVATQVRARCPRRSSPPRSANGAGAAHRIEKLPACRGELRPARAQQHAGRDVLLAAAPRPLHRDSRADAGSRRTDRAQASLRAPCACACTRTLRPLALRCPAGNPVRSRSESTIASFSFSAPKCVWVMDGWRPLKSQASVAPGRRCARPVDFARVRRTVSASAASNSVDLR